MPLDWDKPNGRTIQLAVIRHLASDPGDRIGSMFINPGGPGDTGVGLVQGLGDEIDSWGGGRFDVVSWDPRGTNASTRVRCFTSKRSEARFWKGVSIPATRIASERYRRKTVALARGCGKVSGWLLPHISTADTARDLDYLRRLVGDRELTYVGLSHGTYLGQTYASMFPGRVRAMLLDGMGDPVRYSKSAEARVAGQASGAGAVFNQLRGDRSKRTVLGWLIDAARHSRTPRRIDGRIGNSPQADAVVAREWPLRGLEHSHNRQLA